MESQEKLFDYLKKVSAELQRTRKRLQRLEADEREPVAVVGMGCRLPGGAVGPDQLWDLVVSGTDAISAFPQDRGWDTADPADAERDARVGGSVYDAWEFAFGAFGV